jgi:hypothetical protein
MEKELIPYSEALALKELGFDELCMCFQYEKDSIVRFVNMSDPKFNNLLSYSIIKNNPTLIWSDSEVLKPTFSQTFRWFREKYKLDNWVYKSRDYAYFCSILKGSRYLYPSIEFTSHEEAELVCLRELIKIVKNEYKI